MQESGSQNLLTLYSDVRATPVRWLWYPYIAVGKITLLQGDPGDGKSTMILNLIAEISKGGSTPDGKELGCPQRVIYQCSEDDTAALDDERIRQVIINFRPCLVVIDPIQAYLGNDSDLQIAGRARKLMQRLGMWASVYDCAVILIGHLNKKEGSKDLYRSLGSIDLIAAARSVLQMERDSGDPDVRIVRQIKNSLAPTGKDIRFEIRPETGFRWLSCEDSIQKPVQMERPVFKTKTEKAAFLIKEILSQGDVRSKDMYARLSREGISHRTAEDTKKEIGIHCYRKMRQWYWSLQSRGGEIG